MSKKKILTLVLALALIATCAISGTVAWLVDSKQGSNTFTFGDINIELTTINATTDTTKIVPGDTITNASKITVKSGSEACYLFVKVTETGTPEGLTDGIFTDMKMAEGWTKCADGIWYKTVGAAQSDADYAIFDSTASFKVNEELTKAHVEGFSTSEPTITIVAAAIQQKNISTAEAAFSKLPSGFAGDKSWSVSN